jgi:hypothetical protein
MVYAQNLETSGASEGLADGQAVQLTWKPQHTFVIARANREVDATTQLQEGQVP